MALAPDVASSTDPAPIDADDTGIHAPGLNYFVFGLFFIFGGITSLNDVIIPKLKELFTLNYTQAMLVQFCFFTAYLVIGIPGAKLVKRLGYMRGAVAGLLTMMVGCLLFIPASQTATYGIFLFALFVLASGVVIVQVVANPLISLLGPQRTAHSRLTFAQAFNSLGTTIFPIVGSIVILGSLANVSADQLSGAELTAYRQAESEAIWKGYLGVACLIALVALAVWLFRNRLQGEKHEASSGLAGFDLLKRSRFGYGALCIFVYVGAEVSIGSIIINYLAQDRVLDQPESVIGWMIGLYWGGAMVGRFIGSYFLRIFSPGKILAFNATGSILLIIISALTSGELAAYSLLAVGLMNSIMFPTIFSLACEKLGPRAADGSGIINVAIFGGAVVPLLFGVLADTSGSLAFALILPIICYAIIAGFGIFARKPAVA
ncbi:MAG: glucose/galactose MFS transporter [Altererythrobacter sp.]|mgnify:CR=1 FL=1|nr:glucose/galactose MFS transporter [Altererythrobacter sp.]MBK63394.1 glucose/galactose MFS transporter [Altererythrobacter sp.]|tara:strand:- start:762 stop:2060 length:1299 start_codon:yes stop_codon:yes gene_type:complete